MKTAQTKFRNIEATATRYMFCCPGCGNRDLSKIEDNGQPYRAYDLSLLCVATVANETCHTQWEPNQD